MTEAFGSGQPRETHVKSGGGRLDKPPVDMTVSLHFRFRCDGVRSRCLRKRGAVREARYDGEDDGEQNGTGMPRNMIAATV